MMKKIAFILLMVLSFIVMPTHVMSESREHGIADFYIHIHINKDGSADVEERITNRFIGEFNGVFRNINRRGTGGIDNFFAWEYIPDTGEYIPFVETRQASEGDNWVFTVRNNGNISSFQLFSPSRDEYRVFVYSYTMSQVATRFSDMGQFNHYVIGSEWLVPIENYEIRITFEGAPPAGGELSATVYLLGNPLWELISATNDIAFHSYGNQLRAGETLRIDARFQENWLSDARASRRGIDDRPFPWLLVALLGVASIILIPIAVVLRLARPHKVDFSEKYYDNLPDDKGPALMAYLVRDRQLKIKDVVATLFHLARDGILTISTDQTGDYVFTRSFGFVRTLRQHENFLMDWLFDGIGDGTNFDLQIIREIGENEDTALLFQEKFNDWSEIVKKEGEHLEYFDSYWRRSPHGELEYRKWRAFKRYLKNLTDINQADIDTHVFWDRFLPYALSLGSAKKLMKKLPNIPKPMGDDSLDGDSILWFAIISPQMISVCNGVFSHTHYRGQAAVSGQSYAGFSGGGYSSGSSGGGGGGAF